MKKILKITVITAIFILTFSITAFSHSGRTDSNGGHRDNKNVSGLGYYHYHHGYPAHLHTNGVCPYAVLPEKVTIDIEKTTISDIKSYINDCFIPSFNYKDTTYIIAEDLNNYGFDVIWNDEERSLKIRKNAEKPISSILTENPDECYEIELTDITTYMLDNSTEEFSEIISYNIGGQTIVRLSCIGNTLWNNDTRTINVTT